MEYRTYGASGEAWRLLGQTPIRNGRIPQGMLEWQISSSGMETVRDVGLLPSSPWVRQPGELAVASYTYVLQPSRGIPAGMVRATPRGRQVLVTVGLEHVPSFELGDFWIDRFEVTNREYKAFIDAGGTASRDTGNSRSSVMVERSAGPRR